MGEGERIGVRKEVKHPNYYDIGLVFLERPTELNISLVKVNDDMSYPAAGTVAHVMGWGDIEKADDIETYSDVLMVVDLEVITNEQCEHAESGEDAGKGARSYEGKIYDSMLCTFTEGKDACQGDSGEIM